MSGRRSRLSKAGFDVRTPQTSFVTSSCPTSLSSGARHVDLNTGSSRWKFTLHTTEIFYTPSSIDFLRRTTTTLVVSPFAEVICGSRRQIRRAHFSLLLPSFFLPFSLSIRMLLRLSTPSLCRTVRVRKGVFHHRRWTALCRRASWSSIRPMPFSNPARSSEPVRSGSTASLEG